MAIMVSQIDAWRAARSEHQNLEFKEAKAQFDNRKLYRYCVALANEGGGHRRPSAPPGGGHGRLQ